VSFLSENGDGILRYVWSFPLSFKARGVPRRVKRYPLVTVRLSIAILAALALVGCATEVYNPATNEPLTASTPANMGARRDYMHENSIVLALSGGGLRAAAFAHGVLTALDSVKTPEGTLLDDVAAINAVSGSSLTAAHYGLYGRDGLARFRNEVLLPGFESDMRMSPFNPANLLRMLSGGVNAREDFRDALDRRVFRGATFADLFASEKPRILIQATDLYHRVPFPFMPELFLALCSDLSRYSISDAVAASMAVPVLFAPMVVRSYPKNCRPLPAEVEAAISRKHDENERDLAAVMKAVKTYRDPARPRFIKLGDGGLTDNLAVTSMVLTHLAYGTPYAPLTERDAVNIRRMLLIVVDASRRPTTDWTLQEPGPSGLELILSATDAAVESAARQAADALGRMVDDWQEEIIKFRCGLKPAQRIALGAPAKWECADVKFSLAYLSVDDLPSPTRERIESIPTRLSLEPAQVDVTIQGAREGTLALPRLHTYLEERTR
jgi:NTE family protein